MTKWAQLWCIANSFPLVNTAVQYTFSPILYKLCLQSLVKRTGKTEEPASVKEKLIFDSKKKKRKRRHKKLAAAEKEETGARKTKGTSKKERRVSFLSVTVMKMVHQIEVRPSCT